MNNKIIYLDNAATTKISPKALEAMTECLKNNFGNPSSIHRVGSMAKKALETAREQIAEEFRCDPYELYFTSGGTESDNLALQGIAKSLEKQGKNHIITFKAEHPAVLNRCLELEKEGFEITFAPSDKTGCVDPDFIKNAVTSKTALVSVMFANNETGALQPVKQIGEICREKGVLFHTDAVQAAGHIRIDLSELPVDLMSVSGHKLHASKGIGLLYIKNKTPISPILYGGMQERSMRAGTENIPAAAAFAAAVKESYQNLDKQTESIIKISDKLTNGLLSIPGTQLNSIARNKLPNIINVSFDGVDSETMVLMLSLKNICVSGGSACTAADSKPSHVLSAMGLDLPRIKSAVRFSPDTDISDEEIDYVIRTCRELTEKLKK